MAEPSSVVDMKNEKSPAAEKFLGSKLTNDDDPQPEENNKKILPDTPETKPTIANIPENLREILILAYFNKFSYKQMADILSIPIGTVKSRLHTAVARFAKEWKASSGVNGAIVNSR